MKQIRRQLVLQCCYIVYPRVNICTCVVKPQAILVQQFEDAMGTDDDNESDAGSLPGDVNEALMTCPLCKTKHANLFAVMQHEWE